MPAEGGAQDAQPQPPAREAGDSLPASAYTPRERLLAKTLGGAFAVVGLWIFLHGGLSLLGGFGLDRMEMRRAGIEPPSKRRLAVECLAGLSLLAGGLALHTKARRGDR